MSSPFRLEIRFVIDQHLDAAFLVSRKLGTQLVIKVNFMIQHTSKLHLQSAGCPIPGDLDDSSPALTSSVPIELPTRQEGDSGNP